MPKTDRVIEEITDYVLEKEITSAEAYTTAGHVLLDTLGCESWRYGIRNAQSCLARLFQERLCRMEAKCRERHMFSIL